MPKHLDSVDPGGYVEPIDVAESDLQAVVDGLGLTDTREAKEARNQIYTALEDLDTAAVRTVKAKTVDDEREWEREAGTPACFPEFGNREISADEQGIPRCELRKLLVMAEK